MPRITAREWLANHGIKTPSGRDTKRYLGREKSAKQDPVTGYWTVKATAKDPRKSGGRPKKAGSK